MKNVEQRISRSTGPENYGAVFELLVGAPLSECAGNPDSWEGIRALFYLRNVIAHGRMAAANHTMVGGTPEQPEWDKEFEGGYARVCTYLEKRGLAIGKFGDVDLESLIFSDRVADHFWDLAHTFRGIIVKAAEGAHAGHSRKTSRYLPVE